MNIKLINVLIFGLFSISSSVYAEGLADLNLSRTLADPVISKTIDNLSEDDEFEKDEIVNDPFQSFNRGVFKFNTVTDNIILKPVAKAYVKVVPDFVKKGVSNFFGNIEDVVTISNDLLQLKFVQATHDAGRVVFNTTFGLFGLMDWASMNKMEKHHEDFGLTLAHWGVRNGPYIVLPIIGPSTLRDAGGLVIDSNFTSPLFNADGSLMPVYDASNISTRNSAIVLDTVQTRARYLDASELIDGAALDPYLSIRDAYLARRQKLSAE